MRANTILLVQALHEEDGKVVGRIYEDRHTPPEYR